MAAEVFDQLVTLLSDAKAKFRVIEHEAEGRSEAISVIRGNRPDQAADFVARTHNKNSRGGHNGEASDSVAEPQRADGGHEFKIVRRVGIADRLAEHERADRLITPA